MLLYIHGISVCQQNGISLFLIPFLLLYQFFMRHPFRSSASFIRRFYTFRSPKVPPSLTNLVRVWYATSYDFGMQSRTTLVCNLVRVWLMEVPLSPNVPCAFRRCSLQYPLIIWRLWEFVPLQSFPFSCRMVCCPPQVVSLGVGVAWRVRQFCCVGFSFLLIFLSRALYIIMCVFRFIFFFHCRCSFLSLFFLFFRKKVRKKFAVSENSVTFALAFAHFRASAFRFFRLHRKSSLKVFHRRGSSTGRPFAFFALETLWRTVNSSVPLWGGPILPDRRSETDYSVRACFPSRFSLCGVLRSFGTWRVIVDIFFTM